MSTEATSTIRVSVVGEPVAQPRHRVSSIGGFARAYLPKKHPVHAWKDQVRLACGGLSAHVGPVDVSLVFYLPRAKSAWRKTKPNDVERHASKPDVDNLAKAVLDALNGVLWADDGQVARLCVEKFVCGDAVKNPCTIIEVKEAS